MSSPNSDNEGSSHNPLGVPFDVDAFVDEEYNEDDNEFVDGEPSSPNSGQSEDDEEALLQAQFQGFLQLYTNHPRTFSNAFAQPFRTSMLTGPDWLNELWTGHDQRFYDALRLDKAVFLHLCDKVLETGCYTEAQQNRVGIHECVAIFLVTIGLHHRHREAAERFQRSLETISRHIQTVVRALCIMASEYTRPPNFQKFPEWIAQNEQLFPFFKDCVGAIDGTIIPAWVPAHRHATYRCLRGNMAQNVLAACDFDLNFTFVLSGWEGSANDSRVLAQTLADPQLNFPWAPRGKYYAVDSRYSNFPGFLAPYSGERYHLPEWVGENHVPRNARELFNRRHATVQNCIEHCFGSLKQRFKIIKGLMPNYRLDCQSDIVIACCVIHNFVKRFNGHDTIFNSVSNPDYISPPDEEDQTIPLINRNICTSSAGTSNQCIIRDRIAQDLWNFRHGGGH